MALGICMVAIGISAWTAMSALSKTENTKKSTASLPQTASRTEVPAENKEDNIPKESSSSKATSSKEPTQSSSKTASEQKPAAKYFVYPLTGEIIKDFSADKLQYSVTYNDMRLHKGLDIAANAGTAVKSAGDGTVTEVKKDAQLGYMVKIDHGNNISVVYAGLQEKTAVKKGDTVQAGTVIGALGTVTCESLDAPHLHLEFYEGNTAVSPLELLGKAGE